MANSVICCGSSAPFLFLSRSYQPKPAEPSKSFAKPEIAVESARSAEQARTSGRPISSFARLFTHAPNLEKPSLFAAFWPGCRNSESGSWSSASQSRSFDRFFFAMRW